MTDEQFLPETTPIASSEPRDPWITELAREATDVEHASIPREMMWARVQRARSTHTSVQASATMHVPMAAQAPRQRWMRQAVGIAAVLVGGVGVGRYLVPSASPVQTVAQADSARTDSVAALGFGPDAMSAMPSSDDPAHVAMQDHLVRTVSLLTTVRDQDPDVSAAADINGWARDLLGTTRLLLDQPQLRDVRTQQLLQDLELVLMQIAQARKSAPETKRAPSETMLETNLLPRMRAAVTASRRGDDPTLGGGL